MYKRQPILTDIDHRNAKSWIECLLEGYREGMLSLNDVDTEVGHVLAALDIGNEGEVREAFRRGRDPLRRLPKS